MLVAMGVALLALAMFIFFGPSAESVQKHFTYYGAPGELHLMQEISITDGQEQHYQLPTSLRQPPPPAAFTVDQDEVSPPDGETLQPATNLPSPVAGVETAPTNKAGAESDQSQHPAASHPIQSSRDFTIETMLHPSYPLAATEIERRIPIIVVDVGIFVDVQGDVTEAMVLSSTGSEIFATAALVAVRQWKFKWLNTPATGRWLHFPFNFKSPYTRAPAISPLR